ncbi:MAG: hypothetical protein U9Q69_01230 [Nanoarchaeota archaeon]|nr:hypothetical protein [Nanoarchaeota archaeon]
MREGKEANLKKILISIVELGDYIKAIWLINNKITVLVDDTSNNDCSGKLKEIISSQDKAEFSRNKYFSLWWELARNAEPKTIEELTKMKIIYDGAGFVRLFRNKIINGKLYGSKNKARVMLEKAQLGIKESEKLLFETIKNESFNAIHIASQALLLSYGIFAPTSEDIEKALMKKNKKLHRAYKEAKEKLIKNFNIKDVNKFVEKAKNFSYDVENEITTYEHEKNFDELKQAYQFCLELCKKALQNKITLAPFKEDDRIKLFKKYFMEHLSPMHMETLDALYTFNNGKRKDRKWLEDDVILNRGRVQNLSLAIQDIIEEND